jgi:drug/metabolite transporter (DMT)-like permease
MNKSTVYGLMSISALLGTTIRLTQKYLLKHMTIYSIVIIDALFTGVALISTGLYLGGFKQLQTDLSELHGKTLFAFIGTSVSIVLTSIIGYYLLRNQKLSSLILIHTGVDVIVTMILAYILLGDEITKTKLLSIPVLLAGVYLAQ